MPLYLRRHVRARAGGMTPIRTDFAAWEAVLCETIKVLRLAGPFIFGRNLREFNFIPIQKNVY